MAQRSIRTFEVKVAAGATAGLPAFPLGDVMFMNIETPAAVEGAALSFRHHRQSPRDSQAVPPIGEFKAVKGWSEAMLANEVIAIDAAGGNVAALHGFLQLVTDSAPPAASKDSYADSNRDGDQILGDGTTTGVGQSFAVSGGNGVLTRARFFLSKLGTPTGTIVANLYAHSGVFGTSSVPTGAPLATSLPVDVSTLTGTPTLTDFDFEDGVAMVDATQYVIAIEEVAIVGDGSNHVLVGVDTSAPSHGGNLSTEAGTWSAVAGTDGVFEVFADFELYRVGLIGP